MRRCQQCHQPLATDEPLCDQCEWQISGLIGGRPPLRGRAGQLIWRAIEQLNPAQGSNNRALASQCREAARLLMAAVQDLEEREVTP